eukprot:1148663-Pelagomonas_calceolata.AAC.1
MDAGTEDGRYMNLRKLILEGLPQSNPLLGAEILTIGVELLRRGHQIAALIADGCAEEARQFLRSDKFLDALVVPSADGASFEENSTVTPAAGGSSNGDGSGRSTGSSMGAKGNAGSCGGVGALKGEEGGPSEGGCSLGEAGVEAGEEEVGVGGQENEKQAQQEKQQQQQQQLQEQEQEKREKEQQQQQQREARRDALLQSMKLVVYPGDVSLEEFVSTKVIRVR